MGFIRAGEWLEYTVNVATAGTYTVEVRVASQGGGGTFHIEFGGTEQTGALIVRHGRLAELPDDHEDGREPQRRAAGDAHRMDTEARPATSATSNYIRVVAGATWHRYWLRGDARRRGVGVAGSASSLAAPSPSQGRPDIWDQADAFRYVYQPLEATTNDRLSPSILRVMTAYGCGLQRVLIGNWMKSTDREQRRHHAGSWRKYDLRMEFYGQRGRALAQLACQAQVSQADHPAVAYSTR